MLAKLLPALALAVALPLAANADTGSAINYGFTGAYAPSAWTLSFPSTKGGGTASVYVAESAAYFDAMLPSRNRSQTAILTAVAAASGPVVFDWVFTVPSTSDSLSNGFGYMLNGVYKKLTTAAGGAVQPGRAAFTVMAGDVFGWRLTTNGIFARPTSASAVVRSLTAPIPTPPAPGPLPVLGVAAMFRASRRIRRRITLG